MKLAASLRYSLYASIAALFLSGVLWLAVRYGTILGPRERELLALSMRIHGAATMVMLVLTGCTVALHSVKAWQERTNRISGTALSCVLLLLALTGYLLYYVGDEALRATTSVVHWAAGIAGSAVLVWHVVEARRASTARGTAD